MANIGKILSGLLKSPDVAASIDSSAKSFAEEKAYRDEMVIVYFTSVVAGLIFNCFSLWAAHSFFLRNVRLMVDNHYVQIGITVFILFIVEFFTVLFIRKSTKFFLYRRYFTASAYTAVAVVLAIINFNSSVTGIRNKTQERISRLPAIERAYSSDSLTLVKRYEPVLDSLNTVNARLSQITTEQNAIQIKANANEKALLYTEYQRKLSLLDTQLKLDTEADISNAQAKSNNFWLFMIVVQLFMFAAYIFQSFYLYRSYVEKIGTDAVIHQEAEKFKDQINRALIDTILGNLKQFASHAMHAFSEELDTQPKRAVSMEVKRTSDTETTTETIVNTPYAKEKNQIGFQMRTQKADIPEPLGHPNTTEDKNLQKLIQNKELVRLILERTSPDTKSISNETIKEIQDITQKRVSDSRTFQRNIFMIINAVGRKTVEELCFTK